MKNKRIFLNGLWIIIGIVLIIVDFFSQGNSVLTGTGCGLVAFGALGFARYLKRHFSKNYESDADISQPDERNLFISNRAWAYSGYIFVLVSAVLSLTLGFLEFKTLSIAANAAVCLIITIYWITYLILSKKY